MDFFRVFRTVPNIFGRFQVRMRKRSECFRSLPNLFRSNRLFVPNRSDGCGRIPNRYVLPIVTLVVHGFFIVSINAQNLQYVIHSPRIFTDTADVQYFQYEHHVAGGVCRPPFSVEPGCDQDLSVLGMAQGNTDTLSDSTGYSEPHQRIGTKRDHLPQGIRGAGIHRETQDWRRAANRLHAALQAHP